MQHHDNSKNLHARATRFADKWATMNKRIHRATAERNTAIWKFLRAAVKIARRDQLRSRSKIRELLRQLHPDFDGKTLSRYVGVVRAIVRRKPRGINVSDWVKSQGGISKCH